MFIVKSANWCVTKNMVKYRLINDWFGEYISYYLGQDIGIIMLIW